MKTSIALILFLFAGALSTEIYSQKLYLTRAEAEADARVFLDVYAHHPGRLLYRTQAEIDSLKQSLLINLPDSISYDDFYLTLLQSIVFLKDGHTDLSPGPTYSKAKSSSTTLPFRYAILNDKIHIIDTLTAGLNDLLYAHLISVNSIPTSTILSRYFKYTSADNDNEIYRKRYNERIFGRNFDFFFGTTDEYHLVGINPQGDTIRRTVRGIEGYEALANLAAPAELSSFFDLENDLATLTVNTFNYARIVKSGIDFHQFIDGFFQKVRKEKIQHVTIDVRANWGGAGVLAMSLYAYLAPSDFKWMDYSYTCLDGRETFAKYAQYPNGQYRFLSNHDTVRVSPHRLKVSNGPESKAIQSSTQIPFGPKKKMKDITKNKFSGNLFVLTSGITFSAGSVFATKCSDREKTIVIGEPTGSAAGIFCGGGFLAVSLPHSGFKFNLPLMERHVAIADQNIRPTEPLQPDYLTERTLTNIMQRTDPEMQKVYELIKNNQRSRGIQGDRF